MPFETIIASLHSQKHLLSKLYKILLLRMCTEDNLKYKWETDVKEEITEQEWERINK